MFQLNGNLGVDVRSESVVIPTYDVGNPCPHPMFLEKRVYQGSSGAVYPYPVTESIADGSLDRTYDAVILENEYLKIMILPQLGGRVQMALDKTNDYHFVYYNRVIKPALVGLAGPWISGGIEFNWPQHHRPSTFHPVDCDVERHDDGSATVWCNEIDRMVGTRGMHGFRLYPGKAYLEIVVRLSNRTSLPETFLWWANPAVHVDENHQSVFPPDVTAVMDHGKRDVSSFPIATGEYYKVDYSPGTDISRYSNIPVPTSYMACKSNFDFVGSYDHGRRAGLLHVASHHVSPGKKQWTWGCGDFGQAWDRHLTDEDGPYIELMCGVFTDNQPDFSWLAPGEQKSFSQFFMPYKGIGVIKNATCEAAVGLDIDGTRAVVRAYTTSRHQGATLCVSLADRELLRESVDCDPSSSLEFSFEVPPGTDENSCSIAFMDHNGRQLVSYIGVTEWFDMPEAAKPIDAPANLDSVESLYLAAMHLEQYRHATRRPEEYLREALRRDPGDLRCNVAMGRLFYRRGQYALAKQHAAIAVTRATRHNPNPPDGEPYIILGLAEAALGNDQEAVKAWHKAAWSDPSQSQAYFELAKAAMRGGHWHEALDMVGRCLNRNAEHCQARHLKICALLRSGKQDTARQSAEQYLVNDPFNLGIVFTYVTELDGDPQLLERRLRKDSHSHLQLANDFVEMGLWNRGEVVLQRYIGLSEGSQSDPLLLYHLAWLRNAQNGTEATRDLLLTAASLQRSEFFPNSLHDLRVLEFAVAAQPTDARAWCDLGNLLFSKQRHDEAIACWERSSELAPTFSQPKRNLGLAYFNKRRDPQAAWNAIDEAFRLDPSDARVLFELDQLAKRLNHAPIDRLSRLEQHRGCVDARDDLTIELVTLLNQHGDYDRSLRTLLARRFHPWEGGEGKPSAQYVLALVQMARQAISTGQFDRALELLQQAFVWPESLGEGKLNGNQENNLHFWQGVALRGMQRNDEAEHCFELASVGAACPSQAQFYNDQPPEMIFYQGLALQMLGRSTSACDKFAALVQYAEQHLEDQVAIDFFAVSLPDFLVFESDVAANHRLHCRFMRGLGLIGLGRFAEADSEFEQVLSQNANHLGAIVHRSLCHHREWEQEASPQHRPHFGIEADRRTPTYPVGR